MNDYKAVMMCTVSTVYNVKHYAGIFEKNLDVKSIVIVGSDEVGSIISSEKLDVEFINENLLYPGLTLQCVRNTIDEISNHNSNAVKRSGWYFQQFLKMAYCAVCEDEAYLVWDSDTVPLVKLIMRDSDGRYIFDVKTERHCPYFDTISRLWSELKKSNSYSFISEHMIVDRSIMQELINTLEDRGEHIAFWKKIIECIDLQELQYSGFSEFETYGTYVEYYHSSDYVVRNWKSIRDGSIFFQRTISQKEIESLARKYQAISFEGYSADNKLSRTFAHSIFQNVYFISFFERVKELLKKCIYMRRF